MERAKISSIYESLKDLRTAEVEAAKAQKALSKVDIWNVDEKRQQLYFAEEEVVKNLIRLLQLVEVEIR